MLGTLVNAAAIMAGGGAGLLLKKGISDNYKTTIMQAISLSVILVGARSALSATDLLGVIVCMAVGSLLGEAIGIESRLDRLGVWAERRFSRTAGGTFSKGFVTASLVFCVGSMAIVGSLEQVDIEFNVTDPYEDISLIKLIRIMKRCAICNSSTI